MRKEGGWLGLALLCIISICSCSDFEELSLDKRPDFDKINAREFQIAYGEDNRVINWVKDITIDYVKFPFNGGLIKNSKQEWILFFREHLGDYKNRIGFSIFDSTFCSQDGIYYVNMDSSIEDPRVVKSSSGRIVLVANGTRPREKRRQIVLLNGLENSVGVPVFSEEIWIRSAKDEKNWAPFFVGDDLLFSYGFEHSHSVIKEKDICRHGHCKFEGIFSFKAAGIKWSWGKIRGGTPAQQIWREQDLFGYLSFFHSVFKKDGLVYYFMGAVVFEPKAPFRIIKISKEPIISRNMFKCGREDTLLRNNWIVSYPTGLVVDKKEAIISFGVNDSCIKVASFDLESLIDSMGEL